MTGHATAGGIWIIQPRTVSRVEFIDFWSKLYIDAHQRYYTENISRWQTHPHAGLKELFVWKNSGPLSGRKEASVDEYIEHHQQALDLLAQCDAKSMDATATAKQFLTELDHGGAIWRIFWLHCFRPTLFPIFDQHVYRAQTYIQQDKPDELGGYSDIQKINRYAQYQAFHKQFEGHDAADQSVDQALWMFGKYLKTWHR